MQLTIKGRNIAITPALREHAEKKIGKLARFFDSATPIDGQVVLRIQGDEHVAEVTLHLDGLLLRGEEESSDMYASIDGVVDKLERQIHKYKTRINRKIRGEKITLPSDKSPEQTKDQVVRIKRFQSKPMPVEEAVMQMELLGHDFFVFRNADNYEVNVLYKRKDGRYGLLEPEGTA
ncbi:MAG: ribosome-associated translation inhibitor RaiA [Firmicutes bacterium]|jgi:putative sigma-54 modulation protein|nr:ribosome-associated translation inhibitor RaiA [Bacillota bacterium]HOB21549.1 ribosome-associated translation inhibitor RaiA [Bacillota bacterium]